MAWPPRPLQEEKLLLRKAITSEFEAPAEGVASGSGWGRAVGFGTCHSTGGQHMIAAYCREMYVADCNTMSYPSPGESQRPD